MKRMSAHITDGTNELKSEMEELNELRTEKKILEALEPITELLNDIKMNVVEVKSKVIIHNNYENRIKLLERNQYIFGAVSLFIGFLTGAGGAFLYKVISKI